MKKRIIILFLFILSISSCKTDGPYYKLYEPVKEWGDFKEGTWWKYENEETGEQDCVWIENNVSDIWSEEIDGKIKESGDYINLYLNNTNLKRKIFMRLSAGNKGNHFSIREEDKYGSYSSFYLANLITFDSLLLDSSGESYIKEKFSSFSLNNLSYNNIIHVISIKDDQTNPVLSYDYHSVNEYWIAKYEGIIKKILRNPFDTVTWSLIGHHIVKDSL